MYTKKKKIIFVLLLLLLICYFTYFFSTTSIHLNIPWYDVKYIESSFISQKSSNQFTIFGLYFLTSSFRYFKSKPQSVTNDISFFLRITSKSGDVEYIHWASEMVVHSYNNDVKHRYTLPLSTFACHEAISLFLQ